MAIAIVSGFALSWLAFSTILLLLFFARDSRLVCYLYVTRFMAFSSSAINPCICFIFSENYRQVFSRSAKVSL